ncbi:MAG: hypothetical protein EZS28_016252 [Streblomastix strix]|uniref:Uncharacterized protein n=1 Tax=Streblomastix strix TaxID=222440 RepID=A0A5J4W1A9_9EUKA|nr:MAG: hypothetical protein EZS28_016252 [Streblomastix strix]
MANNLGDISDINQSITLIQQELARYTHFRGYYLLNADIINLASSATCDFTFSAESGTVWMYESSWYDSGQLVPDQVTPASDEIPLVDGTASARISTQYSRGDHIHPQQLTYDNNITATKFVKTSGTATEILLANGDTTTLDGKLSKTYSSGSGGYIRLCVFPTGTSTGAPYIYNSKVDQLLHTHTGSYSSAVYTAWIHIMTGSGSVTVTVSKQNSYWTTQVTEILTQDIVSSITGVRNYSNYSALYLDCDTTAINTTKAGQWEISKTNDNALTINPSSLRQADHSAGLSINSDSSKITFNGNEFVNVGTDQTINDRKSFKNDQFEIQLTVTNYVLNAGSSESFAGVKCGLVQINPNACDPNSSIGTLSDQWNIAVTADGEFRL